MEIFLSYRPAFDFFLLSLGFAYSQQIVLRAGVFSVATAGYAAVGAYTSAILVARYNFDIFSGIAAAALAGTIIAALLSIPLARLRGIFQAIATIAFIEVLHALLLHFDNVTGGASGFQNIPKLVNTWHLLLAVGIVIYLTYAIGRSGVGRTFDSLRQNETVAVCLGVSVRRYHGAAFLISGAFGGLFGGLMSLYAYSVDPSQFGFPLVVSTLAAIVLGGRTTLLGPIVGAAVMASIPEVARPLADYRPLINGLLLLVMIGYLPHGLGDSLIYYIRKKRALRMDKLTQGARDAVA